MTPVPVDVHAGKCMSCRDGRHGLCASPKCHCKTGRHSAARRGERKPAVTTQLQSVKEPITKPVPRTLTREDPPPTMAPSSTELYAAIRDCPPDGQWYRVHITYKNSAAAARAVNGLQKAIGTSVFDFTVTGAGVVYVRLTVEPF